MELKKFEHIISLGHFCGVAQELERLGLRDASYPFDWLITQRSAAEELIENRFEDFLSYDLLYQDSAHPEIYRNKRYGFGVSFYHDFSAYIPLDKQLDAVVQKYNRRIKRFYDAIREPTLFIRYINNEEDVAFYRNNFDNLPSPANFSCPQNELLLVIDSRFKCEGLPNAFYVDCDNGDTVARRFTDKNDELFKYLTSNKLYDKEKREKNLDIFRQKEKSKKSLINVSKNRFNVRVLNKIKKPYIHKNRI